MADAPSALPAVVDPQSTEPTSRALPTPQELLATFEALRDEHRVESERISLLSAQLRGQNALLSLAQETKIHLTQYLEASKAGGAAMVGAALMISMRKNLWSAALTLQNGGLHKQAAEIFVSLLGDVQMAYVDTEPLRLADAYIATSKSLTALNLLDRAQQMVTLAADIEKEARRDIVKRNLGLCAAQGCQKKGVLKCSACNKTPYCSKECQKGDWRRRHKTLCEAGGQAK